MNIARRPGRLSLLLKPCEKASDNGGLQFLSEGYICPSKRGRVSVTLQNHSENKVYITSGTLVGFLVLSPFVGTPQGETG